MGLRKRIWTESVTAILKYWEGKWPKHTSRNALGDWNWTMTEASDTPVPATYKGPHRKPFSRTFLPLVSHDISSMPAAFARYRRGGRSPGVLLPQLWALSDTIEQLVTIWELSDAGEWQDRICYLPTLSDFRMRK